MAIASEAIKKNKSGSKLPGAAGYVKTPSLFKPKKTDSSGDLYSMAVNNGLQREADTILKSQQGEKTKEIFSGGVISGIFDVINAAQYGVVGVVKGKSFLEGVKTRASFTDKDALGDKGLPGIIAGTLLDIAFDPLTYIAPATIVKKVPGLAKALKLGKEAVFGKMATKAIEGTEKTYEALEGGTKLGKYLASKFAWMNGADPVFKETFERSTKNIAVSTQAIADMARGVSSINNDIASKILKTGEDGRFVRRSLSELQAENPLIQEAHKYKTADEFVKAQGTPLYHGSTVENLTKLKPSSNLGRSGENQISGIYLTPDYQTASYYGRKNGVQIFSPQEVYTNGNILKVNDFAELKTKLGLKDFSTESKAKIPSLLKEKGYDGVFLKQGGEANEMIITNPNVIKTKSQLTDIWNKANNGAKVLKPEEFEIVSNFYNKIDSLGKEAVDLGILSKGKYEENLGQYIKNAYTEYELANKKGLFASIKSGIKGVKKRVEGLTPEKMKELGQIDNPAYLLFKSAFDLTKDVENAKLLKAVGDKFGTSVAQEGFIKIADTKKWGQLAGKYVPENISKYLTEVVEPSAKNFRKELVANFKFFKVIMNPATHARNIISNQILNYWKLGMNPFDPRTIATNAEAVRDVAKGSSKWIDEAKSLGYNVDTFASAEMKNLLDSPEAIGFGKKIGGQWAKVKKSLGDLYQGEENVAKLSAYIFNRKYKNLQPEDAWRMAEQATFNYAQVTPFVRKLRESLFGLPFITFTVKSTPVVLEAAYKTPTRISNIGKIKQSIEKLSDIEETDRERASEPAWVKDGFYIKLPMKDKNGRSAYFDLTYILPFGDLISGNFWERSVSMETGVPESIPQSLIDKSPFLQTISSLAKNKDFYGNKIWKDTDNSEKQLKDLMTYITKVMAPPLVGDQLPGGYNEKGERQQRGIVGAMGEVDDTTKRNLTQELLRNVGAKIQPIDADIQETYIEWNKKKALERLLLENGVLNKFEKTYVPK